MFLPTGRKEEEAHPWWWVAPILLILWKSIAVGQKRGSDLLRSSAVYTHQFGSRGTTKNELAKPAPK